MIIKIYVETNLIGSRCEGEFEVDEEDWKYMNDGERHKLAFECLCDCGLFEWGYYE